MFFATIMCVGSCFILVLTHSATSGSDITLPGGGGGGGGGTLIFSAYVGSDPVSTVHSKKYQEFQAPQNIFEILATQNISQFCTLPLKKTPKLHRNDP